MSPQFPSIQSFFERESPAQKDKRLGAHLQIGAGDGFDEEEMCAALRPTLHSWRPRVEYEDVDINSLIPGPKCVSVMGRIVNFYQQATLSKKPQAAKGCLKVVVKDDTGALMVRLWYAKVDYNLRIGQLISVWTPHISNSECSTVAMRHASLVTSIFPERDNTCYFAVQDKSDDGTLCKTPLGYEDGKQLDLLMTLKNFMEGGHEVDKGKILVCVKSVGGRKKLIDKKGNPIEKADVNVFDDSHEITLTLWNQAVASAASWKSSHTILLITNPAFRAEGRPNISLGVTTQVEVDPAIMDAEWLREFAQRLTKKDHVNQAFPEDVFDVETTITSENRILFTIADVDEFVRAASNEVYMGYLSVLVSELNISRLHQRNMLASTECCGVPLFANAATTRCKQCEAEVPLKLNPRLIGTVLDETGSIASGKLVWCDSAWTQVFGRTPEQLVLSDTVALKYLEQRLLFLRITLLFGWSADLGKLAVCGVRM